MDTKRLQEIKQSVYYLSATGEQSFRDVFVEHCKELITALEAAQDIRHAYIVEINELKKQLAEAERLRDFWFEHERIKTARLNIQRDVSHKLRAQLAKTQAEVERLEKHIEVGQDVVLGLRAELAEAQAAVEKFRYEMPELRPEEM